MTLETHINEVKVSVKRVLFSAQEHADNWTASKVALESVVNKVRDALIALELDVRETTEIRLAVAGCNAIFQALKNNKYTSNVQFLGGASDEIGFNEVIRRIKDVFQKNLKEELVLK